MTDRSAAELLEETLERCRLMDVPLRVRLTTMADEVRRLSPEFAAIADRMVERLQSNGVGVNAPKPGEPMPDFVLPDEAGRLVRLSRLLEQGPVVLSFNRGHWCPYCRLNIDALARIAPDVNKLGAQIVAISPETRRFSGELKTFAKAPFPILSDMDGGYALSINLLFWVGLEKRDAMKAGGYDIALYQGNETWMLPVPATFIVGQDAIVRARHIDPDYRHRMEIDELMAGLMNTTG
jgi:peroxiredoxin